MAKIDLDELAKTHSQAREHRRELETELASLPRAIEQAISAGATDEITRLSHRRRDIQNFELAESSALENAHMRAEVLARMQTASERRTQTLNAAQDSEARELEFDIETHKIIKQREQGKAKLHAETLRLQTEYSNAAAEVEKLSTRIQASNARCSEEMAKLSVAA